jgi:hypothetical protein
LPNDWIRYDKAPTNAFRLTNGRSCIATTDDLRASGILDGVIKVGDPLPLFALKNAFGQEVRSSELLAKGLFVLTVFRGSW